MRRDQIEEYDRNLSTYSMIVRGSISNRSEILECIRVFEYCEDYEKCKHLKDILSDIENGKKIR
jgi:hypothetical protein